MSVVRPAAPAAHPSVFEGFDAVSLSCGPLEATFLPELGMVGASLRHDGDELLDRRDGLRAYRDTGAVMGLPLLHPWANRLAGDDYALHGRTVRLPAGPPLVRRDESGLPIHGLVAAHAGWVVDSVDAGRDVAQLRATLDFGADPALLAAFPFPHRLTIVATLSERGLRMSTTVLPTGGAPVPIAFGYHPYLRIPGLDRARWELCFPRRREIEHDPRGIPTGSVRRAQSRRLWLEDRGFDDGCDAIGPGAAFTVAGGGRTIRVRHDRGYPVAQVYSPPGAQFICFEPMTAPVNALRGGIDVPRATPGHPFTAVFTIEVDES